MSPLEVPQENPLPPPRKTMRVLEDIKVIPINRLQCPRIHQKNQ